MKNRLMPTQVHLKDLPPEGREFIYTRESGELNEQLRDLLAANDFRVSFHLTPVGNAFNLRGELLAQMDMQCALCAIDLKFPVKQKLHELLVVQKPMSKGDQLTKANHAHEWEAEGPDYILLESETFMVGDYIHEVIGLAVPIRPLGRPECDLNCENLSPQVKEWLIPADQEVHDPVKANPFQILEKFKLKS
jgi:uncharacterized protein